MAATARTILILVDSVVIVLAGFVVTRMASGAGRLIAGRRPTNELRVRLMTFSAIKIATMIKWFVSQSGMTVIRRCPGIRRMAKIAILIRIKVILILPGCLYSVVAGGA